MSEPQATAAAREGALTYLYDAPPAPAEAVQVAPGVHWLRMPLPFALNHINLWLLEDGDGWTIVDTGIQRPEVQEIWRAILAGPLAGGRVKRVLITHFHPDHIGLAGWLVEELGSEMWITRTEWLMHQMLTLDDAGINHASQVAAYRENGLDAAWMERLSGRGNTYQVRVGRAPHRHRRIADGEEIEIGRRTWHVVVGTGHAPEHACLHCPSLGVLISGDQILPKITPNVSLWAGDDTADPLADYLGSLDLFRHLPPSTVVLPSHNLPFTGLHQRLDDLARHHEERLQDLVDACDRPMTAAQLIPVLFDREMDAHQIGFAMGECLSHLTYLAGSGRMTRSRRDDGVITYRRGGT